MLGQCIFWINRIFEDTAKLRTLVGRRQCDIIESKGVRRSESYDENAFPLLWNPRFGAYNASLNEITKLSFKNVHDSRERASSIVINEILYILKNECFRLVILDDLSCVEK